MSKYLTMITKVVIKLVLMITKVWTADVENRNIEWSENLFNHIMNFSRRSGANGWWWLSISSALQVGKLDLECGKSVFGPFQVRNPTSTSWWLRWWGSGWYKVWGGIRKQIWWNKFYDPLIWRLGQNKLIIFIFPQVTHILNFSLAAWKTPSVMLATSNPFALILISPISYPKVFI